MYVRTADARSLPPSVFSSLARKTQNVAPEAHARTHAVLPSWPGASPRREEVEIALLAACGMMTMRQFLHPTFLAYRSPGLKLTHSLLPSFCVASARESRVVFWKIGAKF